MSTPIRIKRERSPGWRMPAGAVYVGRARGDYGRFGNPWRVVRRGRALHIACPDGSTLHGFADGADARRWATAEYSVWLREPEQADLLAAARLELAGRDLACWCPLPEPGEPDHCHGVVLLAIANAPAGVTL